MFKQCGQHGLLWALNAEGSDFHSAFALSAARASSSEASTKSSGGGSSMPVAICLLAHKQRSTAANFDISKA
jgi:hypothetical protein